MGDEFKRAPESFPYAFAGMNTRTRPDQLPPNKYPVAMNIRAYSATSVRTRPGQVSKFVTGGHPILALGTYAALSGAGALITDNLPRALAYDSASAIYLDTGSLIGTLTTPFPTVIGAVMIPFRPNASPTPWMYVANGADYQKFSAPSLTNVVTQQNVGIAEPSSPPEAAPNLLGFSQFELPAVSWVAGGGAGVIADVTRTTDTIGVTFPDPVTTNRFILQVATAGAVQYQVNELVRWTIAAVGYFAPVEDVLPAIAPAGGMTIQAIYYFTGATGRCVIVPTQNALSPALPTFTGNDPASGSIFAEDLLSSLRRGSLLKLSGGAEIVMVLSVTRGPNNTLSFETTTTGTHAAAETITGLPAIAVSNTLGSLTGGAGAGATLDSLALSSAIGGAGLATYTESSTLVRDAFAKPFASSNAVVPQRDDYVHCSLKFDDITQVNEIKILIDVGDGSFTQNYYYYTVRPSDLADAVANLQTQLAAAQIVAQRAIIDAIDATADPNLVHSTVTDSGAQTAPGNNQWTEITFPMVSFTRVGDDQTLSLANTNAVQIIVNAAGACAFVYGGLYVAGGGQPDVGDAGSPYFYRVRPRSSITGVVGNPSASTRYGISCRRQPARVNLPSAAYDSQIDTWDIFRYGGTVTSWRFIGSTPSSNASFPDNYDDAAAQAGDALDFDNFQPWPTIDVQNNGTATIVGTTAIITQSTPTLQVDAQRYLPGTLVQLGGLNVYTLRKRPVILAANSYLLEFVENAGTGTNIPYQIQEPIVAQQRLPYTWGPDASGTVFACGDPLRPGTLSFAKNYAPDSAPDSYNIEIVVPSEPLIGGVTLDGLAFVASTERWWALYPQPTNPTQRYSVVQQPFTRGLVAPYGVCDDGQIIYWWAKDGIYSSAKGSLTDADLYNLFPHEGVVGQVVTYATVTVQPPDYSRAGTFRMAYANGYLYATYQDSGGIYHTLVQDTRTGAWSLDNYSPAVSIFHHPEQQAGTLLSNTARYDELLMGNIAGVVSTQTDLVNDLGGPIACQVSSAEFDGGDARAPKQWGDFFVDCVPAASTGLTFTGYSLGLTVTGVFQPLTPSANRQRTPVSVGGVVVSDFMGLRAAWSDDFTAQSAATTLYLWQPSFTIQPARAISWKTFGTSFGFEGYGHIREVAIAYVSTAAITLTITSYDGQSPAAITIPSSGGAYVKTLFPLTANKGQLYMVQATSSATFQLFLDDSEVRIGQWGRAGAYAVSRNFGGANTREAII